MRETSKLNQYRKQSGYDAYFSGRGIDLGCGDDVLDKSVFTQIESVLAYDKDQGDANTCQNLDSDKFDFVYSSHCLEHMDNVEVAFRNWLRICKPGGHLIVAVPHEIYYEKNIWPSVFNRDHKSSFRLEQNTNLPNSVWVQVFLAHFPVEVISCSLLLFGFDFAKFWEDQTLGEAVCQVEFIVKKLGS